MAERIEMLKENAPNVCFVAMDFSPKFRHVYDEIIETAILNAGFTPVRSDDIHSGSENVIDEIVDLIRVCRLVVADVTGLNANVLIEVGVAHALGKTLLLLTQDRQVPFDLQPRRVTFYDTSVAGKRDLQESLTQSLRSATHPGENLLGAMLRMDRSKHLLILHGSASESHKKSVYPPVSEDYEKRLRSMSSEVSGIWEVGLALQKLAWSTGGEVIRPWAASAKTAPRNITLDANVFLFGGPGANPFFIRAIKRLSMNYSSVPTIKGTKLENGKIRYRIYIGDGVCPVDQDRWLMEDNIDVGIIVRAPSPFSSGCMLWIAAGIRSFGTEAAIKALTTPNLLRDIDRNASLEAYDKLIWAVVRTNIEPGQSDIGLVEIVVCGICHAL